MVVGVQESQGFCYFLARPVEHHQVRRQFADYYGGACAVAVVAFVAHLQYLGDYRLHVDGTAQGDGCGKNGRKLVAHPGEAVEYLGGVGAVTQYLAQSFVEGAERAVAECLILYDPYGHARRHYAGHGADGVVVMAGLEAYPARGGEVFRFRRTRREPFVHEAAQDRPPERAAHVLPCDGRAGVQNQVAGHARDDVEGGTDSGHGRLGRQDASCRLDVRRVEVQGLAVLAADSKRDGVEGSYGLQVASGRGTPVYLDGPYAFLG